MTVFLHEIRRCRLSLLIWSAAVGFMLVVCVFVYPEMKPQMSQMENFMSDMGSFSSAFGMDKLNFSRFPDYFAIECGNCLGLGGALFAAVTGITMLSKEEKEHTSEFLFTHPVSRCNIVLGKLLSVIAQIIVFNAIVAASSIASIYIIGEDADISLILLQFLAYFLLQIEIALLCFGISAFIRSGLGLGIGLAFGFYFCNIITNITEDAEFLKYLTPFAYADGSEILQNKELSPVYLSIGMCLALSAAAIAFIKTSKKDLSC